MRKLVYDIAMTLDNFVSREDGTTDEFLSEGEHVTDYLERLQGYDTVVMGRKTYEAGYGFGLVPGQRAYPHMEHYIFSRTLRFEDSDQADVQVIEGNEVAVIEALKEADGADIYLCGGGAFAGFLLDHELIDRLVIKLNPVIFGRGIRCFGNSAKQVELAQVGAKTYASGVLLLQYDVKYGQ